MEEKGLHVRIVPMTADHLDEVAELERIHHAVEPEYAGGGTGQLPVRIPCGAG